jgi:hypothetical protein
MDLLWLFVQLVLTVVVIVEWVGTERFSPWAYRTGIPVIHETRSLAPPPPSAKPEFETKNGRFKIVSPQLCLFHYPAMMRARPANSSRHPGRMFYPPFIKGTLEWNDGQVAMQGRISWLLTVFLIQAATGFALPVVIARSDPVPAVIFFVMWTLVVGVVLLFLWRRMRGATRILNEFEADASGRAQRDPS